MDKARYLECLDADYRRLAKVAAGALGASVPSCPEWTVTELVQHVAQVYVDKTEIMRTGEEQAWPPKLAGEEPMDSLALAYRDLAGELTARQPDDPALTWYEPDQTAGFWQRRMAQETVIHRVDAELAAGAELAPIPVDLAVDGIDEVLVCFLAYASQGWPQMFGDRLTGCDGRAVSIDNRWLVRLNPTGIEVTGPGPADATVSGDPDRLLLWLWRRAGHDAVKLDGDTRLVDQLYDLLGPATQ